MKLFWLLPSVVLLASGCRRDMFEQSSAKPLEESSFFKDKMASRPAPPHTVAQGQLQEDEAFFRGKLGTNLVTGFPVKINKEIVERGRERFDIYCSPCHGRTGYGDGMIVQRGFPRPPSYHIDRLRAAPPGYFFNVITEGYGVMYPYAQRVTPADRWAIVAYIRALQLSQNAQPEDVPEPARASLGEVAK